MYSAARINYGAAKTRAASAWDWVKSPSKVKSGGRLLFRLPAEAASREVWRLCAEETSTGRLGLSLGRPNDKDVGIDEMPMLVNIADASDAVEVQRIAQRVREVGGPSSHVLKNADGRQLNCEDGPSPKRLCAREDDIGTAVPAGITVAEFDNTINWASILAHPSAAPVSVPTGLRVSDTVENVDWASVMGAARGSIMSSRTSSTPTVNFGETVAAATLPEHQSVTMEGVLAVLSAKPRTAQELNAFPVRGENDSELTARAFYERFVARTPQQCASELAAPQKSVAWLGARALSITASDFGAAVGHNSYSTPDDVLEKKLWDSFAGNDATAWGAHCEDLAAAAFLAWAQTTFAGSTVQLHHENLMKSSEAPWMAVSPDGFLERTDSTGQRSVELVEFKCPVRDSRMGAHAHPYAHCQGNVPPYYMDQVQGVAGYLNKHAGGYRGCTLSGIWFVVWRPTRMWVTRVAIDKAYFEGSLLPSLQTFYFGRMLPAFAHKYNGRLRKGEIVPTQRISV